MFTGIVQDIGSIVSVRKNNEGIALSVKTALVKKLSVDDSVAINGVCQTVTHLTNETFEVQAVAETLKKSNLGLLKSDTRVHLELAATPTTFLGGHLVQGHVNGLGKILKIVSLGKNKEVFINVDKELFRYIIKEGSIAVDGVSLTVADVDRNNQIIKISLIPHSGEKTLLLQREMGYLFNIEVDVIAKYVERMLLGSQHVTPATDMSYEWLISKGF